MFVILSIKLAAFADQFHWHLKISAISPIVNFRSGNGTFDDNSVKYDVMLLKSMEYLFNFGILFVKI